MARYRKVDPRIWNDEKFRALSNDGKLAFLFILTHPHMTAVGCMRASVAGLGEELGFEPKAFREAFREAFGKGLISANEKASYIGLPNYVKYNRPESPNVVKHWAEAADLAPECPEKTAQLQRLKAFVEGLGEGFREAFKEAFGESVAVAVAVEKTLADESADEADPPKSEPDPPPKPKKPDIDEAAFDAFWLAYPKKAHRKAALKAWGKVPASEVPAVMRGLERWKQSRQWADGFVYDPATWLNGERWTDEDVEPAEKHNSRLIANCPEYAHFSRSPVVEVKP